VIAAVGAGAFLYWRQMPPVRLGKSFDGQNVSLRIKNRTGEQMQNVLILDKVPRGAFVSCGVTPRIETLGNEDSLTWFATLNPGEDIAINYQARGTADGFTVKVGDDEYASGAGIASIIQTIKGKIMPAKKPPAPAAQQQGAPVAQDG
jgi:hypothetical protein